MATMASNGKTDREELDQPQDDESEECAEEPLEDSFAASRKRGLGRVCKPARTDA
jgi:hypothetical protein